MREALSSSLGKMALLLLALALVPSLAAAQDPSEPTLDTSPDILAPGENSAAEEADEQEEPAGYAYVAETGALAVALDTAAVFCPASGTIILHPEFIDVAKDQFKVKDDGNGIWEIADPETGEIVKAKTQIAGFNFDDGRGDVAAEERSGVTLDELATLPVLPVNKVVPAPWLWPRCWRLRVHYRCGAIGRCPLNGNCIGGYFFSQRRNFLQCQYAPWNFCLEFLYPVCTVTRYTCRDCSGPVIFRRPLNRFVCAVF